MASQVDIINMALAHLGQGPVESLDMNLAREVVRKVVLFAEAARDLVIGDHDWLDMQATVDLTELAATATGWAKVYSLPEGFMRMSKVSAGFGGCAVWQVGVLKVNNVETRVLFADSALTRATCVVRVAWETLTPQLALAVSYKIADLACVSVKGDAKLKQGLMEGYALAIADAARIEAFKFETDEPDVDGFQMARYQAI